MTFILPHKYKSMNSHPFSSPFFYCWHSLSGVCTPKHTHLSHSTSIPTRPTNDIALLILSSLPSKIRRDNQQKLLDLYFNELKQNLARISIDLEVTLHYTKEKLLEDYKWVWYWTISTPFIYKFNTEKKAVDVLDVGCLIEFDSCLFSHVPHSHHTPPPNKWIVTRKSQLLALLLCIGSADIALGNEEAEQRFLDVLHDLYKAGVMNIEQLSF